MAHLSPAVNLVWALLTIMLGSFLIFHLWSFDRFKCLKWNHSPHSGAFKRVMTYSYILTIPFLTTYALGFAIMKYIYGYTVVPQVGVMPTPYELWGHSAQNAIFPLYLSLSISWALEMVTHLEELCFWFFLVGSCSAHQDWFRSLYFKIWVVGSCTAVLAMPLMTILNRHDVYKCEAYTFLTGGLASLSLTIWFLPILWTFPSFISSLKVQAIEAPTLVRLTRYHELNCARVAFRFLFTIPFVILGVDGVRPHQHINDKMFPTDLLGIIAGIGCIVSSGITLVIFFPRSVKGEMTQQEQRTRYRQRAHQNFTQLHRSHAMHTQQSKTELNHYDPFAASDTVSLGGHPGMSVRVAGSGLPMRGVVMAPPRQAEHESIRGVTLPDDHKSPSMDCVDGSISLKPNRRMVSGDVELGAVLMESEVELVGAQSKRNQCVTSCLHHWRSPIEIEPPTAS